jgi:hypothetical protein
LVNILRWNSGSFVTCFHRGARSQFSVKKQMKKRKTGTESTQKDTANLDWCGLQATLDEQRQAMVHKVMLDNLQKTFSGFPQSVPSTVGIGVEKLPDVSSLATSGDTLLLQAAALGTCMQGDGEGNTMAISTAVGRQDVVWGGSDIVVFARHGGLLVAANDVVTQIQYPAGNGSWYAHAFLFCWSVWSVRRSLSSSACVHILV